MISVIICALGLTTPVSPSQVDVDALLYGVTNRAINVRAETNDVFSRFLDYPPRLEKLEFPRCLIDCPFRRNEHFWLKDVDFSCASPWNNRSGRQRAGTAISRRHVVFAKHFPLSVGTRILFVGVNGDVSPYYIERTSALDSCDIMIGLLNAELTPDVHHARVLSADFTNLVGRVATFPVVTLTQNETASLAELDPYATGPNYGLVSFGSYESPLLKRFFLGIRGGDSGSPTFLIIGREPVLLFCMTTPCGGYDFRYYMAEVQRAMDGLCPGYKLETFDFRAVGKQE